MNKKILWIIIALLFIALIGLGGILAYVLLTEDEDDTNTNEVATETTEQDDDHEDETHSHESMTLLELLEHEDEENDNTTITFDDDYIYIESNGLPNHETGEFPNDGNPNAISEQTYSYRINRKPEKNNDYTETRIFGTTLGGIPFDPGTAERDSETGWVIEAFNSLGSFGLGIDQNNAHVQPNGAYHYHGIPDVLIESDMSEHSNLIGFAADGFPVYARYGYSNPLDETSSIIEMQSSWQLKSGSRAVGEPSGNYDGSYTNDFEFIAGSGDLDECNGIFTVTPEYPEGTYAYFLTDEFPYIARCNYGTPDESFGGTGAETMGQPPQGAGGQMPPPTQGDMLLSQ